QFADAFVMKGLSRAHENVIATVRGVQTKRRRHLGEIADDVIGLFLWGALIFLRRALDIDAVFVRPGKKKCLNSLLTLRPRNRIPHNHRVEMAEMRETVRVIDWGCNVEGHSS